MLSETPGWEKLSNFGLTDKIILLQTNRHWQKHVNVRAGPGKWVKFACNGVPVSTDEYLALPSTYVFNPKELEWIKTLEGSYQTITVEHLELLAKTGAFENPGTTQTKKTEPLAETKIPL